MPDGSLRSRARTLVLSVPPQLSLIVATKGRAAPFKALFDSLEAQVFRDFEVVVVDQNADDRAGAPEAEGWSFPIRHLRTPQESGLSRARNRGWQVARGGVILCPTDDCWYPPHCLGGAMEWMAALGADVLAGRAAVPDRSVDGRPASGRYMGGRYEPARTRIMRSNVWTTGVEWVAFVKRDVLEAVGGYDPEIGVGAATPWQACEGQDIMLRILDKGYTGFFDPSLCGHRAALDARAPAMLRQGRADGRGFGHVLRRHGYPAREIAKWLLRPSLHGTLALLRGDLAEARHCTQVVLGRLEGWRGQPFTDLAPQGAGPVSRPAPR